MEVGCEVGLWRCVWVVEVRCVRVDDGGMEVRCARVGVEVRCVRVDDGGGMEVRCVRVDDEGG